LYAKTTATGLSPALFLFFLSFGHAAVPFAKPPHPGECATRRGVGLFARTRGRNGLGRGLHRLERWPRRPGMALKRLGMALKRLLMVLKWFQWFEKTMQRTAKTLHGS
jgi:hypothetical protein